MIGKFVFLLLLAVWDTLSNIPRHLYLWFHRLTTPILEGHITVNPDYRLEYVSYEKYPISNYELREEVKEVYKFIDDSFWLERKPLVDYFFRGEYLEVYEPFKIFNLVELIDLYKFILDSGEEFTSRANSGMIIKESLKDYVRVAIMDYLDIIDRSDKFILYTFLRDYLDFQSDQVDKEFYELGMLL